MKVEPASYTASIIKRSWLSHRTFELTCDRPAAFSFTPGQKIQIASISSPREYSIASAPADPHLKLCIQKIDGGRVSTALSEKPIGSGLSFRGPLGYFNFKPSGLQAVFVATGTGIAPFAAMIRSGVKGFILLHGVRQLGDLYYRSEIEAAAGQYIPFISEASDLPEGHHAGRVTDFIAKELPRAAYDFYLCGSGAMIRDVIMLVDERFDGSRVFTEKFY